jgi:predicted dehydrogenase
MLSPVLRCDLEIITSERIYRWDYQKGLLSEENPEGYTVIHQTDQKFERNHLFKTIMQHFLNRLDNRNLKPLCSLSDGLDALCAALASRKSSELGLRVSIEGIS